MSNDVSYPSKHYVNLKRETNITKDICEKRRNNKTETFYSVNRNSKKIP